MPTSVLNMTLLTAAQSQKEVTANAALQVLDGGAGYVTKTITNGTNNLTETEARSLLLVLSGALTANADVVIPATIQRALFVVNLCTGGTQVTVKHSGQVGNVVAYNQCLVIWPGTSLLLGQRKPMALLQKSVAGSANVALTELESQYNTLKFTGALTGNIFVDISPQTEEYTIHNATTGAFTLTMRVAGSGGSTLAVGQGKVCRIYADNVNVVRVSPDT